MFPLIFVVSVRRSLLLSRNNFCNLFACESKKRIEKDVFFTEFKCLKLQTSVIVSNFFLCALVLKQTMCVRTSEQLRGTRAILGYAWKIVSFSELSKLASLYNF